MAFYLMREMAAFEIKILGTYDPAPPPLPPLPIPIPIETC